MNKTFNSTADGQKAMFWQSHAKVAKDNLVKNLKIARKNQFDAVERWRKETNSDEGRWEEYTKEADRLLEIAESLF